jgi:hypothetical protein
MIPSFASLLFINGGDAVLTHMHTNFQFGIKGGDAKAFRYSECRRKPDNPQCAYYELTMSFDFAGRFKGNVYTTDPSSLALVTINKAEVIYDVKGLGEVALPVPSRAPSSIAWADKLKDRTDIPMFDKTLAQLVRIC